MKPDELVPPLFEPAPDNAPGAFYVIKDHCILCGAPSMKAPRCVSFNQSAEPYDYSCMHCRVHKQPETSEELRAMIDAMWASCVESIRYRGTNSAILEEIARRDMAHLCDALKQ